MLDSSHREKGVVADHGKVQQASRGAWRAAAAALAAVVGLAVASLWTAGSGEQNYSVWDTGFWLNSGWRILHGQIPHTDFSLTTGTALGYLTALGMKLRGPCVNSIATGQAVLGALLAAASFAVLRRRTTPGLALAASLFCAMLAMATRQPGEMFDTRSHAFLYNRVAEGFLALLAWLLLVPAISARPGVDRLERLAVGTLVVLLAFTKLTYGVAALGVVGAALLMGVSWRGLPWIAIGAAGAAAGLHVGLGIVWTDWLNDVTTPFRVGYESTQMRRLLGSAVKAGPALAILAGLWALTRAGRPRALTLRRGAALLGLWGGTVLIALASQQRQEYPFALSVALAYWMTIRQEETSRRVEKRWAAALVALLWLPQVGWDAASLAGSWRSARGPAPVASHIDAPPLADFRLAARRQSVADQINDGLALIRAHAPAAARVQGMDYCDVFSFALGRPPPKGGAIFWYPGFSFSPALHPAPELVFQDRPWVIISREARYEAPIMACYGPWLQHHYALAAESQHYRLWAPRMPD